MIINILTGGSLGPSFGQPDGAGPVNVAPTITTASLPAATVGAAYSQQLAATGTPSTFTWLVTSGNLPSWLTLSTGGLLSGTPAAGDVTAGISLAFSCSNGVSPNATATLGLVVSVAVQNTMSLSLPTGTATNYPYQFGRVFRQGEIANFPQVLVEGVAQTTQADVKNRWPDGSVKFAVLSLVVPSLNTSLKTLTFQNQVSGNNTPETKANMLASYDFNCTINATSGGAPITGAPVAARTILNAASDATLAANTTAHSPDSRYWTQGSICTTVILCDHTVKAYDFGTDANKSLRPVFHVQFWPTLSQYRVRVIVEQADTTKIQNQTYDVSVSTGNASPSTVYTRAAVPHVYATRWTKTFWSGSAPVAVNEVHNLAYLASTYALPNYDTTITLAGATESSAISAWASASKDIYDAGLWTKNMPTTGGREDIGPSTGWATWALYSGSAGLWQVARGMADLAGAWPMCFRGGGQAPLDTGPLVFDSITNTPGLGRFVTRDSHKYQYLRTGNGFMNKANNNKFTLGAVAIPSQSPPNNNGWQNDGAHQPDPYFAVYITNGDFWFLEQMQFWASQGLFDANFDSSVGGSGRDPSDAMIQSEIRGDAWILRNRSRASYASVDSSPEKTYLTRATEQVLRAFEGQHIGASPGGLAPTSGGLGDAIRNWWSTNNSRPNNPLRYWDLSTAGETDNLNTAIVAGGNSPWMYSYLITALGITKDLGFGASELVSWITQSWITLMNDPTINNRYILQQYRYPVCHVTPANTFFQTWDSVRAGYSTYSSTWDTNVGGGYAAAASAAVAAGAGETNGATAWANYNSDVYSLMNWASNPKNAIKAR